MFVNNKWFETKDPKDVLFTSLRRAPISKKTLSSKVHILDKTACDRGRKNCLLYCLRCYEPLWQKHFFNLLWLHFRFKRNAKVDDVFALVVAVSVRAFWVRREREMLQKTYNGNSGGWIVSGTESNLELNKLH